MKSTNSINKKFFPQGLLVPLFTGVTLLFLTVNTSCNKDSSSIPAIDNSNNKAQMSTSALDGVEITVAPHSGEDTPYIQAAIDSVEEQGGGIVWLTAGDYNINADVSIRLKSNVTLWMQNNTKLKANASSSNGFYYVIKAVNIHDARVLGGQIIGDRDVHNGTTGEHGMGIGVRGSDNIRIKGISISKCWGDGLYIGSSGTGPSTNIDVQYVYCSNNRRQGLSIIEADGVTVNGCEFGLTNGTAPADGIDIEPNFGTAQNITIQNCKIYSNGFAGNQYGNNGIELNGKNGDIKYVTIDNNEIYDNLAYAGYFANSDHVTFTNNTMHGNGHNYADPTNVTNYTQSGNVVTP